MSQLYGVGQNLTIKKIIINLKLFISQKNGKLTLRNLFQIFLNNDPNRKGFINYQTFEKCLNQFGFIPKIVDMQSIALYYQNQNQELDYNQFIIDLQDPLNERRENFIQKVIHHFDKEYTGKILIQDLKQNFKSCDKISDSILRFIEGYEGQYLSSDDFFYFFYDLSLSLPSDSQFIQILSKSFAIQEDFNLFVTQEEIKSVIKQIRLIQSTSGVHEEFKVRKIFQDINTQHESYLTMNSLKEFLLRIDLKLQQKYLNALFKKFDSQQNGQADLEVFINYLIMDTYA